MGKTGPEGGYATDEIDLTDFNGKIFTSTGAAVRMEDGASPGSMNPSQRNGSLDQRWHDAGAIS